MTKNPNLLSLTRVFIDALLLTAVAAAVYVVSALKIYFGNIGDFVFPFSDLSSVLALGAMYLFFAITVVLFLFSWTSLYRQVAVVLFVAVIGLWAQANLFNWDYGPLDGSSIPWDQFSKGAKVELFFAVMVTFSAVLFIRNIYFVMPYALVVLVVMQVADGLATTLNNSGPNLNKIFVVDASEKFVFSKEKNVIILILDAFQGSVFNEILESTPEYANKLDGFTWFKNASVAIPSTKLSVPNLLSGIPYDNTIPVQQYQRNVLLRHSLPTTFKKQGYQSEYYGVFGYDILPVDDRLWSNARRKTSLVDHIDEYNKLIQSANFRLSPEIIKKQLYEHGVFTTKKETKELLFRAMTKAGDIVSHDAAKSVAVNKHPKTKCCNGLRAGVNPDVDFTNSMLSQMRVGAVNPVFKVYHLQGLHPPRIIDENFKVDPSFNEDIDSMPSSGRASLKMLALFLGELKKSGIYDNSLIFVLADHGMSVSVNPSATSHRAELDKKSLRIGFNSLKGSAIPLILVKPQSASGDMKVSAAPVTLADVPNTAMALSGGPQDFPGVSMFSEIDNLRERLFWLHAYHQGIYDYYGDLQEFSIKGDVYDDEAWSVTGRLLKPGKTDINQFHEERNVYLKGMLPLVRVPVAPGGDPFAEPPFGYLDNTYSAFRAFDKDPRETGWWPVENPNGKCASKAILGIDIHRPVILKAYSISTRYDIETFDPKSWVLEASNDNRSWFPLHQVTDATQWKGVGKVKIYPTANNNQVFSSYRLNISESVGGRCIQINEFDIFELP